MNDGIVNGNSTIKNLEVMQSHNPYRQNHNGSAMEMNTENNAVEMDFQVMKNSRDAQPSSSSFVVSKYDVLKERLLLFLKDNEQIKDELFEIHSNLKKEKLKREDAEQQVICLHKQVEKLEIQNDELSDRLRSSEKRYDEIAHAASIAERERKVLEQKTISDEDKIHSLSEELKESKMVASLASNRIEELSNSLVQSKTKLDFYEQRCIQLEETLKSTENELISSSRAASAITLKYSKAEEEIEKQTCELGKTKQLMVIYETRAIRTQSEYEKLQKQMTDLEKKLESEEESRRRLQIELETYIHDVGNL